MSGTPNIEEPKKTTPATARGDNSTSNKTAGLDNSSPTCGHNCSVYHGTFEVKEIVPYKGLERKFSSTLKNRVLLALLDYARVNKVSPGRAIVDLVEFRLVQLGHLPEWWFERKRL